MFTVHLFSYLRLSPTRKCIFREAFSYLHSEQCMHMACKFLFLQQTTHMQMHLPPKQHSLNKILLFLTLSLTCTVMHWRREDVQICTPSLFVCILALTNACSVGDTCIALQRRARAIFTFACPFALPVEDSLEGARAHRAGIFSVRLDCP